MGQLHNRNHKPTFPDPCQEDFGLVSFFSGICFPVYNGTCPLLQINQERPISTTQRHTFLFIAGFLNNRAIDIWVAQFFVGVRPVHCGVFSSFPDHYLWMPVALPIPHPTPQPSIAIKSISRHCQIAFGLQEERKAGRKNEGKEVRKQVREVPGLRLWTKS